MERALGVTDTYKISKGGKKVFAKSDLVRAGETPRGT